MSQRKPNIGVRCISLAVAFGVICLAFIVVLAAVQIRGPSVEYSPDGDGERTVTVSGLRGEIYDRNGKLLVGNATSYSLLYEYGAMPSTFEEVNAEFLSILKALETTENTDKLTDSHFPIEGVYPNVRYVSAVEDTSSDEYYYLSRFFERHGFDGDTTAEELAEFYIDRCELSSKLYSASQIISLMKLWYGMDNVGFGIYQPYTVAEDVPVELVTYIEESGISGATFKTVSERVYEYPGVASHILGRLGKITAEDAEYYSELGYPMDAYVGISGCEYAFESILHGQDGTMVIKYDEDGSVIEKYYKTEPISGNDVWLTIDIDLQIAAEEGLAEGAQLVDTSRGGAITALDPNTGEVLAIASYPTYDLTQFSDKAYYASLLDDEKTPLLNRALSGVYAPGSTYKIGVALAAMETGYVSEATTCECKGIYDGIFPNPKCLAHHGAINVYDAIQESCNIFFYTLGHKMGLERVTDYTSRLGLGVSTGIELGEKVGTVAGPDLSKENKTDWSVSGDVLGAIGQSDHGYTPLQLGVYMSSIVNGGTRYSAHLLNSVRHFYTDEALSMYEITALDKVNFSGDTYNTLIASMGRVVSENPEVRTYFTGVPVAVGGKTGTAEVGGQQDNALFCGFAPLNEPQIVVSCVIEEGQHGYFAAAATARVFEEYFKEK